MSPQYPSSDSSSNTSTTPELPDRKLGLMVGDVDIEDGSLPELVDDDAENDLLCVRIWRKTMSGLGGGLDEMIERGRAVWVAGGRRKAVEDSDDDDDSRGRKGRARGL